MSKIKSALNSFKNRFATWEGRGLLAGIGVGATVSIIILSILGIGGAPFTGGSSAAAAFAVIFYILGTAASCGASFKYFGKGIDAIVEINTSQNKNTSNSKLATLCGAIAGIILAIVMFTTGVLAGPLGAVASFLQADKLFTGLVQFVVTLSMAHFCGSAAEKIGAVLDPHHSKEQKESPNYKSEPDKAYGVQFFRWVKNKLFPAKNNVITTDITPAQPEPTPENATAPAAAAITMASTTAPTPKSSQTGILHTLTNAFVIKTLATKTHKKHKTQNEPKTETTSNTTPSLENITVTENSNIQASSWKTCASLFFNAFNSSSEAQNCGNTVSPQSTS